MTGTMCSVPNTCLFHPTTTDPSETRWVKDASSDTGTTSGAKVVPNNGNIKYYYYIILGALRRCLLLRKSTKWLKIREFEFGTLFRFLCVALLDADPFLRFKSIDENNRLDHERHIPSIEMKNRKRFTGDAIKHVQLESFLRRDSAATVRLKLIEAQYQTQAIGNFKDVIFRSFRTGQTCVLKHNKVESTILTSFDYLDNLVNLSRRKSVADFSRQNTLWLTFRISEMCEIPWLAVGKPRNAISLNHSIQKLRSPVIERHPTLFHQSYTNVVANLTNIKLVCLCMTYFQNDLKMCAYFLVFCNNILTICLIRNYVVMITKAFLNLYLITASRQHLRSRYSVPSLREKIWLPLDQLQYHKAYTIFPVFAPMMSIVDRLAKKEKVHPKESMRYEMMRFCTLRSFPSEGKPSVLKFAKAGFYYASNKDEVICYCCAKRISNWRPNDDPYEAHKRITPNCSFIVNNAEVNVPVSSNSDTYSNDALQKIITDLDDNNTVWKFDSEHSEDGSESDTTTDGDEENISPQYQNKGLQFGTKIGIQRNQFIPKPNRNVPDNARHNDSGYVSLPVDHFHMSDDLSEDCDGPVPQGGFASMAPISEYRRKDPTPQTGIVLPLKDLNSRIGNIDTMAYQPTKDDPPRQRTANGNSRRRTRVKRQQTSDMPRTATLTRRSSGSLASNQQIPVSARTATNRAAHHPKLAKHPKYSTLSSRIASFNQSPEMHVLPRTLAEAGFYYAGTGDCTRCFWCGIGLRHWSHEDDPWSEHARFSLECDHVLINKGQEFINLVKLALDLTENTDEGSQAQALETTTETQESEKPQDDLEDIMLSDAAQSVRDMGYDDEIIRKAVREVITSRGKEQLNGMNIMEEIFRIEEEPVKNTTDSTQANSKVTTATDISKETRLPAPITEDVNDDIQSDTDTSIQATEIKSTSADLDKKTVEHRQKRRLQSENKALKDSTMCSSCRKNEVCIVFLPCGHLISCEQCGNSVKICMTCGQRVRGTVRTYRA